MTEQKGIAVQLASMCIVIRKKGCVSVHGLDRVTLLEGEALLMIKRKEENKYQEEKFTGSRRNVLQIAVK